MMLLWLCSIAATAQDSFTEGGFMYTINNDRSTVTVTDYKGADGNITFPIR
jgi:hypothetical protein